LQDVSRRFSRPHTGSSPFAERNYLLTAKAVNGIKLVFIMVFVRAMPAFRFRQAFLPVTAAAVAGSACTDCASYSG
jgi:hypothetical protein